MKLFSTVAVGLLVFLGAGKVSGEEGAKDPYAHLTQDSVELDLDTGNLKFNDEPVSQEQLAERLQPSYSVSLGAASYSGKPPVVSSGLLLSVLELIDHAGIDPALVRINLYLQPQLKRNQYHHVEVERNGPTYLNGSKVTAVELAEKQFKGSPFVFEQVPKSLHVGYGQVLSVLRAVGSEVELAGLNFVDSELVTIEAQVYQPQSDKERDVLSAPKVTTKPGNDALIKVVQNGSGRKTYPLGTDEIHQEDLANLGIRLAAKPQIIGDHLRVSGVAILTKMQDREGVFMDGNIPVASYSCSKLVVPFSVVFPPGTDTVDFSAAKVDGKETRCQLKAEIVDSRGMTRKQREQARARARP